MDAVVTLRMWDSSQDDNGLVHTVKEMRGEEVSDLIRLECESQYGNKCDEFVFSQGAMHCSHIQEIIDEEWDGVGKFPPGRHLVHYVVNGPLRDLYNPEVDYAVTKHFEVTVTPEKVAKVIFYARTEWLPISLNYTVKRNVASPTSPVTLGVLLPGQGRKAIREMMDAFLEHVYPRVRPCQGNHNPTEDRSTKEMWGDDYVFTQGVARVMNAGGPSQRQLESTLCILRTGYCVTCATAGDVYTEDPTDTMGIDLVPEV